MQSSVGEVLKVDDQLVGKWNHGTPREQLIIVCHGYESSSKDPTIVTISNGLNELGLDVFTFNFSKNMAGFDIEHQVNDITQVVEYFSEYSEIILIAHSFAALPASIATIHLGQITGLVTLNGFFGHRNLGSKHLRNYTKFRMAALVVPKYRKILKYFKQELQPHRIKAPVLVIHSKADKYVLIEQSRSFYRELASPKYFIKLETANHGITSSADRQKVISQIQEWVTKTKSQ